MDIRSIIDSEETPPARKSSVPTPAKQEYRPNSAGYPNPQAPAYDNRREVRPPQPSPLQTPAQNDPHYPTAPPHDNIRSPYQRTPSFGLNNGQYPPAQAPSQSPIYSHQALHYPQREGNSVSGAPSNHPFGHSTPHSQTPTASTPGSASAYSTFPRPSSSHSIPTPNSTQNPSSFLRESPQPSQFPCRNLSQTQGPQQYASHPGTPLGPPSSHGRPNFNPHHGSPGSCEHHRSLPGGSHGQQQAVGPMTATARSPSAPGEQYRQASMQGHSGLGERERSVSVSPKTRLPSLSSINRMESWEGSSDPAHEWRGQVTPAKRKAESDTPDSGNIREPIMKRTPSRSVGVSGLLNAEPLSKTPEGVYHPLQTKSTLNKDQESEPQLLGSNSLSQPLQLNSSSPSDRTVLGSQDSSTQNSLPPQDSNPPPSTNPVPKPMSQSPSQPEMPSSFKSEALKALNGPIDSLPTQAKKTSRVQKQAKRPIEQSSEPEASQELSVLASQPAKKKPRIQEPREDTVVAPAEMPAPLLKKEKIPRFSDWRSVPEFAKSVRGPQRTEELFERNLEAIRRNPPLSTQVARATAAGHLSQMNGTLANNGQAPPSNGAHLLTTPPMFTQIGPLGPWEHSITNTIPAEELTRIVSDWLFENVVLRGDVGVAPAGGGRGLGAVLEIEAKIGQLIDRNTNDRLRLPVMNECVVSHEDPNMRLIFKSSMTETQHRTLNKFLNQAVLDSQPQPPKPGSTSPPKPRQKMTYKHTKEVDRFYDLTQQGAMQIPHSVSAGLQLHPRARDRAKVRITTDEKTGQELAKIIKAKVADIDIYSPRTLFDWRISVNVEIDFNIDKSELVEVERRDGRAADRRKDRVSYEHLAYQIDLTQVAPAEPANKLDKEHELEIEVSSAEVRNQGLLARAGEPNGYEDLIRGFVDNVRLLARYCKE